MEWESLIQTDWSIYIRLLIRYIAWIINRHLVTVPVSYILDNFFLNICDNLTLISFVLVSSSGKGDDADFYYHSLYSVLKKELLNYDLYLIASGEELNIKFDNSFTEKKF